LNWENGFFIFVRALEAAPVWMLFRGMIPLLFAGVFLLSEAPPPVFLFFGHIARLFFLSTMSRIFFLLRSLTQ